MVDYLYPYLLHIYDKKVLKKAFDSTHIKEMNSFKYNIVIDEVEFLKETKPHSVGFSTYTKKKKPHIAPVVSSKTNTDHPPAMADPPPPLPTPPSPTRGAKGKGQRLLDSPRFPVLVSGQVSFTTAAAIKDIELVPKHVYRIQVDLRPQTKEKHSKMPLGP